MSVDKILLIEDEAVARELARVQLQSLGFFPVIAEDAGSGMELIGEGGFSLLITDYQLPDMNALSLVKMVKERYPELPVVVLSAHPDPQVREAVLASGADLFMRKPFNAYQMQEKLIALFGRGRLSRERTHTANARQKELFLELFPEYYKELSGLVAAGDWPRVQRQLHRMKGALDICGNPALREMISALNDAEAEGAPCNEQLLRLGELLDEFYGQLERDLGEDGAV